MQQSDSGLFTGTITQLCAAFAGTIFAISDGMAYGWTAPMIPYLISKESHIKTTKYEAEWLETTLMAGSLIGLPLTIYLVDKIGRKKSLLGAAFFSLFGWITVALAKEMISLFIVRFFFGITANMSFVAAPMYVAEIADQKVRGYLSTIIYINMLLGLITVYSVGPFLPFYVAPVIAISVLLIQLTVFPFMPESPYFLIYRENYEEAAKSLKYFRPNRDVDIELKSISTAVARQKSETGKIQDIILVPSNRKAIIIMTVLDAGQHMCALSVILMNLHLILEAAGSIYMDSSIAAILFAVIMLVSAEIASFQVDKFGRKALLIISTVLTSICLLMLAVYFHLKESDYDVRNVSWIPIFSVMFYAASFKIGMGLVPIVITAEIFSTNMKALGMTISDATYVIGSIISLQLYQWLSNSYGLHLPFYFFSFCSLLISIFTLLYIPETKGRTLEEIQLMLKGRKLPLINGWSREHSYNTFQNHEAQ